MLSKLTQMALIALQYMRGRLLRTVLTTLAVVFGVALIFGINITLPSAMDSFRRAVTAAGGNADLTIVSATGESFAPDAALKTIASVSGVKAVAPVLRRQITLPSIDVKGSVGESTQLEIVGINPTVAQVVRQFVVSEGRFLEPNDSNKALLPAAIAEVAPQLKVGATLPLITAGGLRLYTIVGLLADNGNISTPQITVTLADAQSAFNQPGLVNAIEIALVGGADRDAVGAAILQALGKGYTLNTGAGVLDAVASLEIGLAIFNLFGMIALFIGAFLIFNTFRTVTRERQHDLGMLRAIGAVRGQITQLILIESVLQGVIGSLLGLVAGYLFAVGTTAGVNKIMGDIIKGVQIQIMVTPGAVIGALMLGILTTLVAGYLPARAAARISPLEALRPTSVSEVKKASRRGLIIGLVIMAVSVVLLVVNPSSSALGAITFLIGVIIAAPALVVPVAHLLSPLLSLWFAREGEIAQGNMVRQPGRAAITASTLMIGLATLIMIAAIVNSFGIYVTRLVNRSFGGDLMILPPSIGVYTAVIGADETLESKLHAVPDVQTVASLRYATSKVGDKTFEVLGIDPQAYPQVSPLDFVSGSTEDAFPKLNDGRNTVINSLAATALKLQVGDDFTMETANGPQTYHVVGIANDVLSFKVNAVFISQANLKTDFNKAEDVLLMLVINPSADKAAVKPNVEQVMTDYPQFTVRETGEYRKYILDYTVSAMNLFYVLGIIILIPAALGLLNTLTINVLERTREIGVVRATGANRGQVRKMVIAEALLLSLFGAAIGVIVGIAMSYGFVSAFGAIGWTLPYVFPVVGIIASVIVAILLALISSIIPARNAAKLDIIRALQYE